MPTYEYMCKKCGPFTQLRAMAECDLPSACPECRARSPPCHPDCAGLPHHVGRSASAGRKVRAHHRKIRRPRPAALRAPAWIVQEGATSPKAKSVSASLTESRVASSLKHRGAASDYCASAMLSGPNRVAALVFHPHSGLPRPAVCMIAHEDSNESHPQPLSALGQLHRFRDIRFMSA